jgi:hypothetical protein
MTKTRMNQRKILDVRGTALGLAIIVMFVGHGATAVQPPVQLGGAGTFGVLAGTTVTTIPTTTVNGDLGVSPGNMVTGAPIVNGNTYTNTPGLAATAQGDLTTAYNDAAGRTLGAITVAGNLGGQTLTPGLYKSATSLEISSGDLTLDAQGDANAVFIFQMASTLVTTVGRQVILSGGAQAGNIFWQVGSSATIGGNSTFQGNILAYTSVSMNTGATLQGRVLARNGGVSLDANTITVPVTTAVLLVSAAAVTGPYTEAVGQSVNAVTRTITVPRTGATQYYRIRSGTALTITSTTLSGGNVVITYD